MVGLADEDSLGDLDVEAVCREAGRVQGLAHLGDNVRELELHRRHVDGHAGLERPGRDFSAGFVQHPSADLDDLAVFLGSRNEGLGRNDAKAWPRPAHQRLHAHQFAGLQRTLRLVGDRQFVALAGVAQRDVQHLTLLQPFTHLARKHCMGIARQRHRLVERGIGMPEQDFRIVTGHFRIGEPQRGADDGALPADGIRQHDALEDALAEPPRLLGRQPAAAQHGERCAVEPRHVVESGRLEPADKLLQQDVSLRQPQRIVDRLEAGEIEDEHGQARGAAPVPLQRGIDDAHELGPRQRPGQRIVRTEKRQFFLAAPAIGLIPEGQPDDAPRQALPAAKLGQRHDILHDEATLARITDEGDSHRRRDTLAAVGKGLLDGAQHRLRDDLAGEPAHQFEAANPKHAGRDAAGRDDAARLADDDETVEIVLEHACQSPASAVGFSRQRPPEFPDRADSPLEPWHAERSPHP